MTRNILSPPGKYPWQEPFKSPQTLIFCVIPPPFSKFRTDNCPPSRKSGGEGGGGYCVYINDFPNNVICKDAIYADDNTPCSKYHQASDLWQQLEFASELESDLRDTVDWGRKWFVDFSARKTQFVSV